MKNFLAVIAFLLSVSVQAANVEPDAVCWNDGSDEVDCATKALSILEQASLDDEDDCSVDGSSCHENLVQSAGDCTDKNGDSQEECQVW